MTGYYITYIDVDNASGMSVTGAAGTTYTPTDADILNLYLEDDDGYLDHQTSADETTAGIANNDPSALGTTGFEAGEMVQYYKVHELTGSDGSVGHIYYLSNDVGSGTQGIMAVPPFVAGVTYTVGGQVKNAPVPYTGLITCFVGGTHIETAKGNMPIERLAAGDVVRTQNGMQPVRWIGATLCPAIGAKAPILIRKGALGNTRDLRVSPQHRMLITGGWAELLFGEAEVLVPAKSLVNDGTILRQTGGVVEYYHLLFDRHEIIYAESIPSESFHPDDYSLAGLAPCARDEILSLFPELKGNDGAAHGAAARLGLKPYEGELLAHYMTGQNIH